MLFQRLRTTTKKISRMLNIIKEMKDGLEFIQLRLSIKWRLQRFKLFKIAHQFLFN